MFDEVHIGGSIGCIVLSMHRLYIYTPDTILNDLVFKCIIYIYNNALRVVCCMLPVVYMYVFYHCIVIFLLYNTLKFG